MIDQRWLTNYFESSTMTGQSFESDNSTLISQSFEYLNADWSPLCWATATVVHDDRL